MVVFVSNATSPGFLVPRRCNDFTVSHLAGHPCSIAKSSRCAGAWKFASTPAIEAIFGRGTKVSTNIGWKLDIKCSFFDIARGGWTEFSRLEHHPQLATSKVMIVPCCLLVKCQPQMFFGATRVLDLEPSLAEVRDCFTLPGPKSLAWCFHVESLLLWWCREA